MTRSSLRCSYFTMAMAVAAVTLIVISSLIQVVESVSDEPDDPRITGGETANPGDFPYFVMMRGCAGSLIAPDVILYAAHCGNQESNQVLIGAYENGELTEGAQSRFCEQIIFDPLFTGDTGGRTDYDFALCKLDSPVEPLTNADNQPVTLVLNKEPSDPTNGQQLTIMGLGYTSYDETLPKYLQCAEVSYIPTEDCNSPEQYAYSILYDDEPVITDAMMCASGENEDGGSREDSCSGDSGAPMIHRTVQSDGSIVDTHVGMVSWGIGCGETIFPGVYSRTSHRAEWIEDTICEDFQSVSPMCNQFQSSQPPTLKPSTAPSKLEGAAGRFQECDTSGRDPEVELIIRVTTSNTDADETEWTLYSENFFTVYETRRYSVNNMENEHSVCIPKGDDKCFNWELKNNCGGSFSLELNGVVIRSYTGSENDKDSTGSEDGCNGDNIFYDNADEDWITSEVFCTSDTQPPNPSPAPVEMLGPTNRPTKRSTNLPTPASTTRKPTFRPTTRKPTRRPTQSPSNRVTSATTKNNKV